MSELTARAYKVLVDGRSCHGGTLTWSLPTPNEDGTVEPGQWQSVEGVIEACVHGLHLTHVPAYWWTSGAQLFEAEYVTSDVDGIDDGDKIAVRTCRLIREVAWEDHHVWSSGEHTVTTGLARAYGSATVRAYDSATVEAYDSATVRASGSATVRAYDSATVEAYDSATVEAYGSANLIRSRWHSGGWVKLADLAAVVDRRTDGTVEFHAAPWSDAPSGAA